MPLSEINIQLLGPWQITFNGKSLTDFRGESVRALLAYIVLESKTPQSRRYLASLLWGDQDEESAMRNVRVALTRLKKGLGEAADHLIYTDRQAIGVTTPDAYNLDVVAFTKAISSAQYTYIPGRLIDRKTIAHLKKAVSLYRADFLQGFTHPSLPFEEWMIVNREKYHHQAIWALDLLSQHSLRVGNYHDTLNYASRQIELEPWREEAHQQIIQAFLERGNRSSAIAQFQRCAEILEEELGAEPSALTYKLYQDALALSEAPARPEVNVRSNLPLANTPFFNRENELELIQTKLADPNDRLITLTGEGGVGKSRLSLYAAHRSGRQFQDGSRLVQLSHIDGNQSASELEKEITLSIADAIDLNLAGNRPLKEQLFYALEKKEMLLLIDNLEHILPGTQLLVDILNRAPNMAIICTSRQPLNYQFEVVIPLAGLKSPAQQTANFDQLQESPAVMLLLDRAERAGYPLALTSTNQTDILNLCHLLGGNPLAMELAAALIPTIGLEKLIGSFSSAATVDLLVGQYRDIPERHRNIRNVIDQSWRLLPAEGQAAFANLSVFVSDFEEEAAKTVAEAAPSHLTLLKNHSLVKHQAGAYSLQPLLRAYGREKLSNEQFKQLIASHVDYYLSLLASQTPIIKGEFPQHAMTLIGNKIENMRQAWRWGYENGHWSKVQQSSEALSEYFNLRGRLEEACDLFQAAAEAEGCPPETQSHLLMHLLRFVNRRAKYDWAATITEQALNLTDSPHHSWVRAMTLIWQCQTNWQQGRFEQALSALNQAETIANRLEDQYLSGRIFHHRGIIADMTKSHDESIAFFRQAVDLFKSISASYHLGVSLGSLGTALMNAGNHAEGREFIYESLEIKKEMKDLFSQAVSYMNLGFCEYKQGNVSLALAHNNQALEIIQECGFVYIEGGVLGNRGNLYLDQKEYQLAKYDLERALEAGRELQTPWVIADSLNSLFEIYQHEGQLILAESSLSQAVEAYGSYEDFENQAKATLKLLNFLGDQGRSNEGQAYFDVLKSIENRVTNQASVQQIQVYRNLYK